MLVLKKDGSSLGVTKRILLDRDEIIELGEGDFVKVNHDLQGFYRSRYDEDHMAFFKSAMLSTDSPLDDLDIAGIITDLHHVSVAGEADVLELLSLLPSLSELSQPLLWNSISDFLTALQGTFWEQPVQMQAAVMSYGASIFAPLYDRLGFDARPQESSEILKLRNIIVKGAVMTGYPPAIKQVSTRFRGIVWEGRTDSVSPDLKGFVLDYVGSTRWKFSCPRADVSLPLNREWRSVAKRSGRR
jgi:aminopeptidase 2